MAGDIMKQKLKGGGESDVTGRLRGSLCYLRKPGVKSSIKRKMRRRLRREAKLEHRNIDLLEFDPNRPDGIYFPWEQGYEEAV